MICRWCDNIHKWTKQFHLETPTDDKDFQQKIDEYKFNLEKLAANLHTNDKWTEKEIREATLLKLASKI